MICHSCNQEIVDGSAYCYRCGARQPTVPLRGPEERKRLMRSRRDKKIAGVCRGFAEFFELDPTLIRLVWLLVTVLTALVGGTVAYLICWFVIPLEPEPAPTPLPATHPS